MRIWNWSASSIEPSQTARSAGLALYWKQRLITSGSSRVIYKVGVYSPTFYNTLTFVVLVPFRWLIYQPRAWNNARKGHLNPSSTNESCKFIQCRRYDLKVTKTDRQTDRQANKQHFYFVKYRKKDPLKKAKKQQNCKSKLSM